MDTQNELYHYGVKRRSGRYPWGSGKRPYQSSGGKAKNEKRGEYEYELKREKMTRKQLLAFALSIPTFGLSNAILLRKDIEKRMPDSKNYEKEGTVEKIKDLKRKTRSYTQEEDAKIVNFNKRSPGRVNNCVLCTVAYDMRRRGYDVQAKSSSHGFLAKEALSKFYKDPVFLYRINKQLPNETRKHFVERAYNDISKALEEFGTGARGYFDLDWQGAKNSGHAIAWEVVNGKTVFYDAQSGKVNPYNVFALSDPRQFTCVRLDNLEIKDEITEGVMNRNANRK